VAHVASPTIVGLPTPPRKGGSAPPNREAIAARMTSASSPSSGPSDLQLATTNLPSWSRSNAGDDGGAAYSMGSAEPPAYFMLPSKSGLRMPPPVDIGHDDPPEPADELHPWRWFPIDPNTAQRKEGLRALPPPSSSASRAMSEADSSGGMAGRQGEGWGRCRI
jgi:hypothetical protein